MSGYFMNFIVYTAAMIGVIFMAVLVYKKFSCSVVSKSRFLNVEDCINIAPRKNLYVIRAGAERFLVASDVGRTTLISKLDTDVTGKKNNIEQLKSSVDDLPEIVNFPRTQVRSEKKVFKNIINNL